MRVTLLTYGSRGDVQPFLALAKGLQRAGHEATLAGPQRFGEWVQAQGVGFVPLPGDPEVISQRFNDAGRNPVRTMHAISGYVFGIAPQVAQGALFACRGADLVVHGFLFTAGGHAIACQSGIPDVSVQTFPMFAPTRGFPNVSVPWLPAGWLSYASHRLFDLAFRYGGALGYQRIQRRNPGLGLPAQLPWPFDRHAGARLTPLLFAFSPVVIPPAPEWREAAHIHTIGYLHLEDESQPRRALVDFLAAGEPPVCISFGSMINKKLERLRPVLLEALTRSRQRAVLLSGWGGWIQADATRKELLVSDSAPHGWLLPRCSFVIHHGGAGTTAAALRAGRPSTVMPLAGDQPFWARRVDSLEVGPPSVRLEEVTLESLVNLLEAGGRRCYQEKARQVGEWLTAEDGVGEAVRLLEEHQAAWRAGGKSNLKKSK